MKYGKNAGKRILSFLLMIGMILTPVSEAFPVLADNTPEENGYITDVKGLEVWDRVWLKKSVTIEENVVITGEVIMEPGVKVTVNSGQLIVETQAVVTGDIDIEKRATLILNGSVYGTVRINSTGEGETQEDWDGTLVRPNNISADSGAYVETLVLNGTGFGWVDCAIDTLEVTKNMDGDYNIGENAEIQNAYYAGGTYLWSSAYIHELHVTGGVEFGINSGSIVECARVSGGQLSNNGEIRFAIVEEDGILVNNNVQDTAWPEALIENAVVKETANAVFDAENNQRCNLENSGNITNLLAYGGDIYSSGHVEHVFAENCNSILIETCSWRLDRGGYYQVNHLYAVNSGVLLYDSTDGHIQRPLVQTARFNSCYLEAGDAVIEELYLEGCFSDVKLGAVDIYELYLGDFTFSEEPMIEVWTPEQVAVGAFKASTEAKDTCEVLLDHLFGQVADEADKAMIKEFLLEVEDIPNSGMSLEKQRFTREIKKYDIVTIEFSSASALGAVIVTAPSGYEFLVTSKDDRTIASFLAYEAGTYSFRVVGDDYGAGCEVEVVSAARLKFSVFTQASSEFPEEVPKEADTLKRYQVSIYDLTTGKEFTAFSVAGEEVYFQENPKGHRLAVTLNSKAESWRLEAVTKEVSLNEGETKQLEFVVKQFGEYYGYTQEGIIPQVYLYDAGGNFLRVLDTDSYGNFWTGWMPSGEYTAVFLQDAAGSFLFTKLSDFEAYGLKDKEDYIKDTFTLEAGRCTTYPNVPVPPAPSVENPYFNTEVTAFNTNRQTTVAGELIQLTLNYAFREEYAKKVSGLVFRFPLPEGIDIKTESVTLGGKAVKDCVIENGALVVPAEETAGSICFQISSKKTDAALVMTALAEFILGGKENTQFLGSAATKITALSMDISSMVSSKEIYVTGYTTPGETVSILDNGEEIAVVQSNSSGYYSAKVTLSKNYRSHKLCAAKQLGTAAELRTREQMVSVNASAPELLEFCMYYYVHGHSAEFKMTGEEFQSKRFVYDYWPGSVFTFEIKLSDSRLIDQLYVVSNNGGVKKLQAFYQPEEDIWVASGIFSEDENYAPADFDIEYLLREIDVKTEIGDYDVRNDSMIDPELLDLVYESGTVETDVSYDEQTNRMSAVVNTEIPLLDKNYSTLVEISCNETTETPNSLLARGYNCTTLEGMDYYTKTEIDWNTGEMVSNVIVLFPQETASGEAGELKLFSVSASQSYQQSVTMNVSDALTAGLASFGKDALSAMDAASDLAGTALDAMDAYDTYLEPFTNVGVPLDDNVRDAIENVKEWYDVLRGKESDEKRKAYFDKLAELEGKIDQLARAQMAGKAGKCDTVPLEPYYDGILAAYQSANNIANAEWSYAMINKICSEGIGAVLGDDKLFGKINTKNVKGLDKVAANILNNQIDDINDALSAKGIAEWLMDQMAGNTLSDLEASNAAYIEQLEASINQLLYGTGGSGSGAAGSVAAGSGAAGSGAGGAGGSGTGGSGENGGSTLGGGCLGPGGNGGISGGISGGGGGVNWDPSGYVFEAVPSNRLSGVTAVTYYRAEDGSKVLWDAEEYGQVNPQVTDSKGCYGWFVPEGFWKVVYTKDGYETEETDWLPVPPPQTEVNVGLVSSEVPKLISATVTPDSALVTFGKYLTVESVTAEKLILTDASGNRLSATVEAVNAEEAPDGRMLASKFRIVPNTQLTAGSEYTILSKEGMIGYNGRTTEEGKLTVSCVVLPEELQAELGDYVPVGEEWTFLIHLVAKAGFDTMRLECNTDERFLEVVSIGDISPDGTAEIVVRGKKAGASLLTVQVAGTDAVLEETVVTAGTQDTSLIKYVELQKNKSAAIPSEKGESNMIVWGIVAVVLTLLFISGVMLVLKKKKKAQK